MGWGRLDVTRHVNRVDSAERSAACHYVAGLHRWKGIHGTYAEDANDG